jgi:hypothetical protein
MLDTGFVPQSVLTAAAMVFTAMFALGLAIELRDLR